VPGFFYGKPQNPPADGLGGHRIELRLSAPNKSEKGTLVMTPRTTPQGFSGFFFVSEGKGR
jgi:hypothetical protein